MIFMPTLAEGQKYFGGMVSFRAVQFIGFG